jgi:chromate transport protein ChrA
VTTCTRPHLALVVVIVAVAVGVRAGRRRGLLVGGAGALAWAVLIVPFLLGGLARFSPLHVAAKVTGERGISAGIVAIALAAAALLGWALWRWRPGSDEAVGWFCAAVLFAPSVLSMARSLLETGAVWEADLTLGATAVPFAVWAMAAHPPGRASDDPTPDERAALSRA